MRVQLTSFWESFGFFSICNEEGKQECWFFHSKHQGREIAEVAKLVCSDKENIAQFVQDIEDSDLSEQSSSNPLHLKNREAFTLQNLIRKATEATADEAHIMKASNKDFKPHTYFILMPDKDDRIPSALIVVCNENNRHLTFVLYAKDQAEAVLKRMVWESQSTMKRYRQILTECNLPQTSPNRYAVVIDEPMSCVLHYGIGEARSRRGN